MAYLAILEGFDFASAAGWAEPGTAAVADHGGPGDRFQNARAPSRGRPGASPSLGGAHRPAARSDGKRAR